MNRGEFNTWQRRHQALFPNLTAWLEQQPEPRVILDAWAKALESCHAMHATDATDRMIRGVGPVVEFNDWSTLPAVIIQHCKLLGSGKADRAGDGNFVSGAAAKALRQAFREEAAADDAGVFAEFESLVDVMSPEDYPTTKQMILDRLDSKRLGARSAFRLLVRAKRRCLAVGESDRGNVGDAWEGGGR